MSEQIENFVASRRKLFLLVLASIFSMILLLIFIFWVEIKAFLVQIVADYLLGMVGVAVSSALPTIIPSVAGVLTGLGLIKSVNELVKPPLEVKIPDFPIYPQKSSSDELTEPDDYLPIDSPPVLTSEQQEKIMKLQEYLDSIAQTDNGIDGCFIFSTINGGKLYNSNAEGYGGTLDSAGFSSRLRDLALYVKNNLAEHGFGVGAKFLYSVFTFDKLGMYIHADEQHIIVFANLQGARSLGKLVEYAPQYIPLIKEKIPKVQ